MSKPYRILDLIQGTDEWKAARLKHLTASQAPVLFSLSPYQSRLDLFEEKLTGKEMEIDEFKANLYARGHATEEQARVWIRENMGIDFKPGVLVSLEHPDLLASLDGHEEAADAILEAKYVGAGALAEVKEGKLKPHHVCQVQAQLLVSGAKRCIYMATDPAGNAAIAEIKPDRKFQAEIAKLAADFMKNVREGNAPDPEDRDTFIPEHDPRFDELLAAKRALDAAEESYERMKKAVAKAYEKHRRVRYGDIFISRSIRKGNVAYAKIPELKNVDLDQYRGKPTEYVTVRFGKGTKE